MDCFNGTIRTEGGWNQKGVRMATFLNRRQFLGRITAGGALAMAGISAKSQAESPGNRVVLGVAGMSRGRSLAETFSRQQNCAVKYVCDTDANRLDAAVEVVAAVSDSPPRGVGDLRRMLDDPEVDAVVLALPVHWHAPAAIMACEAGKHVYVEKPCCHNPWEGERLVEAARRHDRVVQMGNQRRSSAVIREAVQRLHDGDIGRVYYARSWYANQRGSIGHGREATVPNHLDYELWQGPAPRRPYRDNVIHYNWHWLWHWGSGELGNNGVHILDICRWALDVDYPKRVNSAGGRYRFDDDQETPDTHMVSYDFAGGKSISYEGLSCNVPGAGGTSFGATFYGEDGSMTIGSRDYLIRDSQGDVVEQRDGSIGDDEHASNFLDAIRNEQPDALHSQIQEGYRSTLLCHLGNIAHRTGHSLRCDGQGHILDAPEAQALWKREYADGWESILTQ